MWTAAYGRPRCTDRHPGCSQSSSLNVLSGFPEGANAAWGSHSPGPEAQVPAAGDVLPRGHPDRPVTRPAQLAFVKTQPLPIFLFNQKLLKRHVRSHCFVNVAVLSLRGSLVRVGFARPLNDVPAPAAAALCSQLCRGGSHTLPQRRFSFSGD